MNPGRPSAVIFLYFLNRLAMKRIILLCAGVSIGFAAFSRQVKDTAKILKYAPVAPLHGADSGAYNNRIYRNSLKKAEYQNRGAEDRRNPNSADPNAIPDRRMPYKSLDTNSGK